MCEQTGRGTGGGGDATDINEAGDGGGVIVRLLDL